MPAMTVSKASDSENPQGLSDELCVKLRCNALRRVLTINV